MRIMKSVVEMGRYYFSHPAEFVARVRNKSIFPSEANQLIDFFQCYQSDLTLSEETKFIISFCVNVSQMVYLLHSESFLATILSKRSKLQPLNKYLRRIHCDLHFAHEILIQSMNFFYFSNIEEKNLFDQNMGFLIEIIVTIKKHMYSRTINIYPEDLCFYLKKKTFFVDCLPSVVSNVKREIKNLKIQKNEYPENIYQNLLTQLNTSLDVCKIFKINLYLKSKKENLGDLEFKQIIKGINLLRNLIQISYINFSPSLGSYVSIQNFLLNQLFVELGEKVIKKETKLTPGDFKFWNSMKHELFQSLLIDLMCNASRSKMSFSIRILNIILEYLSPREINRPQRLRTPNKIKFDFKLLKSKSMTYETYTKNACENRTKNRT